MEDESRKKFFLHYNFPPYSVGEAGFMRAPGRRELGHGNLAERALKYVMPSQDEFPYTVRLVSEITESNGSSSQASICGGSLALMAAGVPIKSTVAGIAMGLIKEGDTFTVLTDIQGLEDHLGDMDFKVAGTRKGITAIQMDIKIEGITREIMEIALRQALEGRMFIIDKMESVISEPRPEVAENAPKIELMKIDPSKIAGLIGPAGKVIKAIIEETGVSIDIEDDGSVAIFGKDPEMMKKAIELVKRQTQSVELNAIYEGKVTKLMKFGAFVEVLPGKEGLLHISEISDKRVGKVEDVLKEIPKVREDLGYPPLVTPMSQMIGTQSVFNVLTGERYKMIPKEIKDYVRGMYGKSPVPISEEMKKKIIGDEEVFTGRPADLLTNEYDEIKKEVGNLARNEEDVLTYAMFPQVAQTYFEKRNNPEEEIKVQTINVVF